MSDQEETMRIVAEIVDKFSKPLREMRQDLKDTTSRRADPHLQQSFEGAGRAVRDLRNSIRGGLTSALTEFGVGAISVAGAVSLLKSSILGFTQSTVALGRLNRETGVSVNYLRQLEAVGGRVGVMPETMRGGMSTFARNMQQLRAGVGGTLSTLFAEGDLNVRKFAASLRSVGSNEDALKKILEFTDRIPDAINKERFLEAFGLPAQFGLMSGQERARAFREAAEDIGRSSKEAEQAAHRFDRSLWRLGNAWEGLKLQVGESGALDTVRDVVTELRNFVQNDSAAITDGIKDIAGAVEVLGGTLITSLKGWHELKKIYTDLKKFGPPPAAVVGPSRGPDAHKFDSPYNMDFLIDPDWWRQNVPRATKKLWGSGDIKSNPPTGIIPPKGMFLGPSWQTQESLKKGTKEGTSEGVVDGFKKMMLEMPPGGSGAGRFPVVNASYDGTGGIPPRHDRMPSDPSKFDRSGAPPIGMKPLFGGPASSDALADDRARYAEELKRKPQLLERILGISLGENKDPRANLSVIETIMNRASARGTSLEAQMRSVAEGGYYPSSTFSGGAASLRNAKARAMAEENLRRAFGGSNVSNYATDNSSQGLAWTERYGGARGGYGRPGQAPGKFNFQSEYGGRGGTGSPGMETFFSPGWGQRGLQQKYQAWRDNLARREAERKRLQEQRDQSRNRLMEGVVKTGFGGPQKVEGDATVRIDLNGFPRGTRTDYDAGGMFKSIEFNRGRVAPIASEEA